MRILRFIVNWLVFLTMPVWILPCGIYFITRPTTVDAKWMKGNDWFIERSWFK